jgi:hypothetical protein
VPVRRDTADALAGKISTGAGTKILIDPCG